MDRREFIRATSATAAAGLTVAAASNRLAAESAKASKKRVGLIGAGWYGKCDLFRMLQVAPETEVVSVCDVDSNMLADAAELIAKRQASGRKPRTYSDFRKLLAAGDIDSVLIGTPDHWHALPMIESVQKGLDVWVQKPISIDVAEGHAMVAAARKYDRVVQVGLQRRSTPHLIEARDRIINEGLLGDIGLAEVYCYYHMRARGNPPDSAPPANLDYEMWTGPAPMRPYNSLVHPRRWRAFMEYSNGIMGDMCVHMLDTVRWMLDLGWPSRIASVGGILVETESKANTADTQAATFDFDDLKVIWEHRTYGSPPDKDYPWGATLYGDKGTLRLSVHRYDFEPHGGGKKLHGEAVYEEDKYPSDKTEKDLERHVASAIRGHMRDWLANIDSRGRPVADIEQGHISTASCIMANIAMRLGRTLEWDPTTHTVVGDEEATKLLSRPYRAPWTHPTAEDV